MVCISTSFGRHFAKFVFIVQRLMEWRCFHFLYQPWEALNSESSENSFAFKGSINPLTVIPVHFTSSSLNLAKVFPRLVNILVT